MGFREAHDRRARRPPHSSMSVAIFGNFVRELIGHRRATARSPPPAVSCANTVLISASDHLTLALAGVRQSVSHEVHAAALPGRLQVLWPPRPSDPRGHRRSRASPRAIHDASANAGSSSRRARLRGPIAMPSTFAHAIGVDRDGDYHGDRDDAAGLAHLRRRSHRSTDTASRLRSDRSRNALTRSSISAHSRET